MKALARAHRELVCVHARRVGLVTVRLDDLVEVLRRRREHWRVRRLGDALLLAAASAPARPGRS